MSTIFLQLCNCSIRLMKYDTISERLGYSEGRVYEFYDIESCGALR